MRRFVFVLTVTLYATAAVVADTLLYTLKKAISVGSGFLELVGPGKFMSEGEALPYEGTWYINSKNIDSMSGVSGVSKGCILRYSSEGYTETVSLVEQSCVDLLREIKTTIER